MSITVTFTFATHEALREFVERAVPLTYTAADAAAQVQGKPDPQPKAEKAAKDKPAAAPAPADTKPSAAAEQTAAQPDEPKIDYATLSAAVLKLMKLDPAAPGVIAQSLGHPTFKAMKEAENGAALFAKAHALVTAKLNELAQV